MDGTCTFWQPQSGDIERMTWVGAESTLDDLAGLGVAVAHAAFVKTSIGAWLEIAPICLQKIS